MAKTVINSGQILADIAGKYENKQEWHNAIEAHKKAAVHYERAILNESDALTRQILNNLKSEHEEKIRNISLKSNQPSETIFDMKKLEQEIFAIQRGEPIGNSYAVVPTTEDDDNEDEGDPFNRFWGVVEPMVNKLSQTSSPPSSPWQLQQPMQYDTSFNEAETARIHYEMSLVSESFFAVPANQKQTDYTQPDLITATNTLAQNDPKQENKKLKSQIADIKNEIQTLQQRSVDSTVLKSSIIQFKNDVHKQALRILQTQESAMMTRSAMTTGSPLTKNIRHVGTSTAEIMNRIRELEEANKILRSQTRKQDALMNKYRERWEKLKEGAKKRRPSSPTSTTDAISSARNSTLLSNLASTNPPSSAKLSSSTSATKDI